jgi:hypothetical protein
MYHHGSSLGRTDRLWKVWNNIYITNTYFIKDGASEIKKKLSQRGFFFVILQLRLINRKITINRNW